MISILAKSNVGRVLLIPVLFAAGFWSWLTYLVKGAPDAYRKAQLADWWGYLGSDMGAHWSRLADPSSSEYGSAFHSLKNIGTEWARLSAERTYKSGCFILVCAVVAAFVCGVAFGRICIEGIWP
jgi:hypothetical protein